MAESNVEKDVCEFYGIPHELYIERVCGIGRKSDLKEFGIEIDESKLSNFGAKKVLEIKGGRWMKESPKVEIKDKLLLTIEEASAYSGISERVLRDRLSDGSYNFIFKNGTKTLIKRRLFEKYLEGVDAI